MRVSICTMFCLSLTVLSGCALFRADPPEVIVAERAQQRLDLLLAYEVEASYAYMTPGYRSARTWQEYSRGVAGVGMWLSATVASVDCGDLAEPVRCDVAVLVDFKAPRLPQSQTYLRESWVKSGRDWYLYQKP